MVRSRPLGWLLSLAGLFSPAAWADVHVGVTLSLTGPGASLGIPARNAIDMLPREVGGEAIRYTVIDDASDPAFSVRNFRRLADEQKVDVVMGSSVTPATLPLAAVAAEKGVPLLSLAASAKIVQPMDASRRWVFKVIQNEALMMRATIARMKADGVRTLAFVGFSDAYGEAWLDELRAQLPASGIRLVAEERYAKTDASVVAQALKITTAKPDAVFIAASGTPGALPQKTLAERGFRGKVYQTYGIANRDFLRVAGKDAEGAIFAVGPVMVASQLAPANPVRAVAADFVQRFEAAHGSQSVSVFAANVWDAGIVLRQALGKALAVAKPGAPAFRAALRDALEATREVVTTQGVCTMSAADHSGYDTRAVAMVQIQGGEWKHLN